MWHLLADAYAGHTSNPRVLQKELVDFYMDSLTWMKALKKDPIHKKIMATREDYIEKHMFDSDEVIASAVDEAGILLKRLSESRKTLTI